MSGPSNDPAALYIVGTPIGNLEDISLRAKRILRDVDLIAAEDTRTAKHLLSLLGISPGPPIVSLFEGNERVRIPSMLERLARGERVALISEAGMPTISDPGFLLSNACIRAGIPIDVIPGPSALTTALVLSGFSAARFRFIGFLPRKGSTRSRSLDDLAQDPDTIVVFESPHRIRKTLLDLDRVLGERPLALIREMTKIHQDIRRGSAAEINAALPDHAQRGEITLVIAPQPHSKSRASTEALSATIEAALLRGDSVKTIADTLNSPGRSRREIYRLALQHTAVSQKTNVEAP